MATISRWCVALAALSSMVVAPAQTTPVTASRLAAAKLAETRGDLAAAEAELRQALEGAGDADRNEIRRQLAMLQQKQGKLVAAAAPEALPAGDPVQRLIADLELGSVNVPAVDLARKELLTLGALAVPPLLEALPRCGPFGLANVLWVLRQQEHAGIVPALVRRLDGADPAVLQAIVENLAGMRATTAVPVARALATRDLPPRVLLGVFAALRKHAVGDDETRALALRLAKDPSVHDGLQNVIDNAKDEIAMLVHAEVMASGVGYLRGLATLRWVRLQPGLTEDAALEPLQKLPPDLQGWVARDVVAAQPHWVRIGLLALRRVAEAPDETSSAWFQDMQWWRLADQAGAALLALPERMPEEHARSVARAFAALVERGWTVPAASQRRLVELMLPMQNYPDLQRAAVQAIPVTDEDGALATWDALDARHRRLFTSFVVQLERPWHRLVARQLAACANSGEVAESLICRDWSGAPADAVAALVATVERWPLSPDGKPLPWHDDVVGAYRRCPNLPAAVVLPLAPHYGPAWSALAEREPKLALALARPMEGLGVADITLLARLLGEHGSAADVPLAVRLMPHADSIPIAGVETFLQRHGSGRLEVIALGLGGIHPPGGSLQRMVVNAAKGARIEDLLELMNLMDGLAWEVYQPIVDALERQASAEHGPAIAALLLVPRSKETDENRLRMLARFAARTTNPVCLPPLRQLLAKGTANGPVADVVAEAVAKAMLELAGAARRPMLEELLASPRAVVVAVALVVPELRADAALRAMAKAAVLRLVDTVDLTHEMFEALPPDDAQALARELLLHERFVSMASSSSASVLEAPRRAKRTIEPALLARAASHQDSDVRTQAAMELGNTFTREAAPFLIEMLKDAHKGVRDAAQRSLDQIANYLDAKAKWEQRLK